MTIMEHRKYLISVGEPWDFNSPDGQNIINGVIFKILSDTCLIFKANYTLNLKEVSGKLLILYPRYAESNFSNLQNGDGYVPINGNILLKEYNESMNEDFLKDNSKFVIIGSIRT